MTRVHRNLALTVVAFAPALFAAPLAQGAVKYPTVSKVSPLKAGVGDTLTIRGKGFRSGKNKNTVVFRSAAGKTVFAKAGAASSTRIQIVIPAKLLPYMTPKNGAMQPTRFRIRVVAKKLGKKYTASSKSPLIGPIPSAKASSTNASASGDCDGDGIPNSSESDMDNDYVNNTTETAQAHTDPCNPDTDGDGILDGYEIRSALEFNGQWPYPGKRPYPNALDGTDANIDFDSDSLTLYEEYMAWTLTGRSVSPSLSYSDGNQNSGGSTLTDDLKDVDGDGLDNFTETHGPMMGPEWWTAIYGNPDNACGKSESPYPTTERVGPPYKGTNFVDADTDGDGVLDGADDEDEDGYSNAFEAYRPADWCTTYVSTEHPGSDPVARVQPFNPCKPTFSSMCHLHKPDGYYPAGEDWESPYHGTL